jgi:sulfur carrier protein ThiS
MTQPRSDSLGGPTITVHPHGELTTYFGRSYGGVHVPIEPGITIERFLERLGVPAKEVWLVARNGEQVTRDVTLEPGDSLELFAPVAGG